MSRFVVLWHALPADNGRSSHFDLMLEDSVSGNLQTWAIERFPGRLGPVACLWLAPHRLAYLSYEGPVSDNRGHVIRIDQGAYSVQQGALPRAREEESSPDPWRMVCQLQGTIFRGTWSFTEEHSGTRSRMANAAAERPHKAHVKQRECSSESILHSPELPAGVVAQHWLTCLG